MLTTTATITSKLEWTQVDTSINNTRINNTGGVSTIKTLTPGTGIDQVDAQWNTSKILPSGGSHAYDLTSLTKELFGSSFTLNLNGGVVKGFEIRCVSTGVGHSISVSVTGTNGFTSLFNGASASVLLGPGDPFSISAGHNGFLVSSTNKLIHINDVGALGAEYEIGLVARTGL